MVSPNASSEDSLEHALCNSLALRIAVFVIVVLDLILERLFDLRADWCRLGFICSLDCKVFDQLVYGFLGIKLFDLAARPCRIRRLLPTSPKRFGLLLDSLSHLCGNLLPAYRLRALRRS